MMKFRVEGMTCGGCANKVRNALTATDGISDVEIDVPTGAVKVLTDGTVPAADLEPHIASNFPDGTILRYNKGM